MSAARSFLRSSAGIGLVILLVTGLAFVLVYQKDRIRAGLRSGDTVTAVFASRPDLDPSISTVKIADVEVGTVTAVGPGSNGTTVVEMKVDDGIVEDLGSAPTARVRSTIILGGRHFVELKPSPTGTFAGEIPVEATAGPEELGDVLRALDGNSRKGLQDTIRNLAGALDGGGDRALRDVLREAPDVGRPAIGTLRAVRGTNPATDLRTLVPDLRNLAAALGSDRRRLDSLVNGADGTTEGLARASDDLAATIAQLPTTLPRTRETLDSTTGILVKLEDTAASARPVVKALGPVLDELDAALRVGGPVVRDLRPLLLEAQPLAADLTPTVEDADDVLRNLDGSVIKRVKGPVVDAVTEDYHGVGEYQGNGNDNALYKELAYLAARGANQSKFVDKNGTFLALALGAGLSSVGGTDLSLVQMMQELGVPLPTFDPLGSMEQGSSADPSPGAPVVGEDDASGASPVDRGRGVPDPLGEALGELVGGAR